MHDHPCHEAISSNFDGMESRKTSSRVAREGTSHKESGVTRDDIT
jgi:hypothetical protein